MEDVRWLTYDQAAARVRSSERAVCRWRRDGLGMGWQVIDGQRTRVVREDLLLAWWRDRMDNHPVHQAQLRRKLEANGIEYVPPIRSPKWKREPDPAPVEYDNYGEPAPKLHEPLEHMKPMAGRDEYVTLLKATRSLQTGCRDVDAFTAEPIPADELATLEAICTSLPGTRALCQLRGRRARTWGSWGGRPYGRVTGATIAA